MKSGTWWKALAAAGAAVALVTVLACGRKGVAKEPEFKLVADSLGDAPMHPDALKLDNLALAHDGSLATRWTTVGDMEPGYFLELDLPKTRRVAGLVLDASPSPNDYPRRFVVEVSDRDNEWVEAAVCGPEATAKGITTVTFARPYAARKILLTLNEAAPYWWSVYEIKVKYAS